MNNSLMVFEGQNVEVFNYNGEVLFNPRNVGDCLDISDTTVRRHLQNFNEKQVIKITNSNVQDMNFRKLHNTGENFLTESGVYKLIFKSRKEEAERFQDWVTDEVLPTIRKTGGYVSNSDLMVETYFGSLDDNYKTLVKGLFSNIENQQKQISELKPKADNYSMLMDSESAIDMLKFSKIVGVMGRNKLFSYLRNKGVLMENENRKNCPYSQYEKYFEVIEMLDNQGNIRYKTLVKPNGQDYIIKLLKKDGIIKN